MRAPFALRLAWRESRATGRRLGLHMLAITLGVGALVAINSFRGALASSINAESKALLGGDLRLGSGRPFPDSIALVLDSAAAAGIDIARVTGTLSMAIAPNGNTRLVQVRAVSEGYPFYGIVETRPGGLWDGIARSRDVLVDPAVLLTLDVRVGDTLRIGEAAFRIAGEVTRPPVELGFQNVIAPRVFISPATLEQAGLIRFGSIVRYQAFLRIPDAERLQRFVDRHHDRFRRAQVSFRTAEEEAEEMTEAFDWLSRFFGLVGLAALLLGGLGVASAVDVCIRERRPQIAMLRCLGATRRTAFVACMFQALVLGAAGALLGVVVGVLTQSLLSVALGDALPVRVGFRFDWLQALAGLGMGIWVAALFSLAPLLGVRKVPPLQALRASVEPPLARFDPLRALVFIAIAATVVTLGILQAASVIEGLAFAGGLAVAILALRLAGRLIARAARRTLPANASFALRQGISGLFRPDNQTAAVTMALGFGVFLITCIWAVQSNLLGRISPPDAAPAPDLVAFDIQTDQLEAVRATLSRAASTPEFVPIVPARIIRLKGKSTDEILSGPEARDVDAWAIRREYRHTYRATLSSTEHLVQGEWWDANSQPARTQRVESGQLDRVARISIEEGLARSLDLGLGDHVTWDMQGVEIESRVTSVRRVDWARYETNFFVVFEPGVLDTLPQTWVTLVRVPDAAERAGLQRELARNHPDISTLDLSMVSHTLASIIDRITLAIRAMAILALAGGAVVLAGALAAGRHQRARETLLLRTLGATRRTARNALLAEYAALGALAGLAGVLMGLIAGWGLSRFIFELPWTASPWTPMALWAASALLAITIGAAGHRGWFNHPPLAALRAAE